MIVSHFPQNNLKNLNPLTTSTDSEPEKQKVPIDKFNKLNQKLDEDTVEIQDPQQGIRLGFDECRPTDESNKYLLEEVKAKIMESNNRPSS